jgi:hypothetical protein
MECERAQRDEREEEQVLQYKRLDLQDRRVRVRGVWEGDFLDARPCEVDVEEE